MAGLPAMLNLVGRRCLIVGGGSVARRRAASLTAAGAAVCVVAPTIDETIRAMEVETLERAFASSDLEGVFLVVIATDTAAVNEAATAAAKARHVLVNRADQPEAGDLTIPAHRRVGPITVAVDTGGVSASAAARLADAAVGAIDPAWATLIETAGPWRRAIQQRFPNDAAARSRLLRSLTDPRSMTILECRGAEAVEAHWRSLIAAERGGDSD